MHESCVATSKLLPQRADRGSSESQHVVGAARTGWNSLSLAILRYVVSRCDSSCVIGKLVAGAPGTVAIIVTPLVFVAAGCCKCFGRCCGRRLLLVASTLRPCGHTLVAFSWLRCVCMAVRDSTAVHATLRVLRATQDSGFAHDARRQHERASSR